MNYIVGFAGTHGTGKSTVVKGLKERGWPTVDTQLSRAAQAALGWESLKDAVQSVDSMWQLQDAILNAMYDRDQAIMLSGRVTAVERTPADVWAYTKLWCTKLDVAANDERAWRYKMRCRSMAVNYAAFVYVPMRPEIAFVSEANRAALQDRDFVADEVLRFITDGGLPMVHMYTVPIAERVNQASRTMALANLDLLA